MSTSSGARDYGRFDELAEEFAERYRRGDRPSLQEYVDRLPEMAEEIREMFPAMVEVEQAEDDARGDMVRPPPPVAPHLSQIGDYRILREVGRGGMGVVYEAEQVSLGRRVALKVLPGHVVGDRKSLERFRREAKAAARLHHTNIVPVFEVGREGDVSFYAMQLILGQGLDQVIDELRRLREPGRKAHTNGPVIPKDPEARATVTRARVAASSILQKRELNRMAESLLSGRLGTEGPGSPVNHTRPRRLALSHRRRSDPDATSAGEPLSDKSRPPSDSSRIRVVELRGLARRQARLGGRYLRPSPAVFPERGPDRPSGGAGAGLRPRPRHRPPRHQALELAARHGRGRLDHRLRPGQGRGRRPDGHRRHPRDAPLHGARAVPGRGRRPRRHLLPGPDPLRAPDSQAGLQVVGPTEADRADQERGTGPASVDRQSGPARPGDDRPQGDRQGPGSALPDGRGDGRGPAAVPGRRADQGPTGERRGALRTMGPAQSGDRDPGRSADGGADRRLRRHGRALVQAEAEPLQIALRSNEQTAAQTLATKEAKAREEAQEQERIALVQKRIAVERAEQLDREDYVNRVNRAYREVQDGNVALAEALLHGCPPERRGWEWHFVERLCNLGAPSSSMLGYASVNPAGFFSPDGTLGSPPAPGRRCFGRRPPRTGRRPFSTCGMRRPGQRRKNLPGAKGTVASTRRGGQRG